MRRVHHLIYRSCLSVLLGAVAVCPALGADDAQTLLDKFGISRGICVVLGEIPDEVVLDLADRSELLVYRQVPTGPQALALQQAAESRGLGGTRIQIEQGDAAVIHLADNLADVAVVSGPDSGTPKPEILRILRPRGRAWIGDEEHVKLVPEGTDDWPHPYHGSDNNPLSADTNIIAPYLTQFLADPRYGPAPQVAVAAGGRVFKAYGNVAWHEREESFLNTLVAYDGYNGTILWKYKLPDGMMVHRNVFVATPDLLYLGDDQSCKRIDTATGAIVDEITPPGDVAGGTFWKWMAIQDDTLYAVVGAQELKDEAVLWKRSEHGWPWDGISRGYNQQEQPWGYGQNLLAIDTKTKKVLWSYREQEAMDCRAVCMSHGRIYAFSHGAYLTCVDAATGKVVWRKSKENDPALFATMGPYLPRQSWQTNWRTAAYLKCTRDAIYFAGTQFSKLLVLSTEDGRVLWEHPYDNFQLIIQPDAVYAISGPWGENISKKFHPLTGEVLAELPTGRRACTRPTATTDSILFRAMGGSVRFDLEDNQPRWLSPMRPACHDGVTIANGLLYWWPYGCDCQLNLYGVTCLGSAGSFNFAPDWKSPDRLESEAGADQVASFPQQPTDWPMFRANAQGTATSLATIPSETRILWSVRPATLADTRPSPPVAAGGMVFLGGSDGVVRALEAATGQQRWTAYTAGEVRLPPSIWDGRALVGSGDGWVYSLEAATGRRLWRFRGAPADRKIPVYGRLVSTWPVSSGILLEDDTAYFAAGIVNYDGTYVYAVDPATGYIKWCNDTSGHLDPAAQVGVGAQGHMLSNQQKLYLAGGNAVSPAIYDQRDGRCLNDADPLAKCESTSPRGWELFLVGDRVVACGRPYYAHPDHEVYDHTVFKKILHASAGDRDIVWLDNQLLMCYTPLDAETLNNCVTDEKIPRHITQAWGEFKVDQEPLWGFQTTGGNAIAVAKNAVAVAVGSNVVALDIKSGQRLWTHQLPAATVPWGLAVDADGRVIVTLVDGHVVCIGTP